MRSGRIVASRHQVQRRDAVGAVAARWPSSLRRSLEQFAHLGIVLDDQDRRRCGRASATVPCHHAVPMAFRLRRRLARREHDLDGEDRALARLRADADPMAQQIAQALHDGETEAEAAAPFARGIVELMVLLEDRLKFLVGDADSGVPDLDAQHSLAPTATEQHLAAPGVFQRVRKQVADHLLEQARIAADRKAARDHAQGKPLCLRVIGELIPSTGRSRSLIGKSNHFGADGAGLDLVYVEQRVQHARHGAQRLVEPRDQLLRSRRPRRSSPAAPAAGQAFAAAGAGHGSRRRESAISRHWPAPPAAWPPPARPPCASAR